MKKLIFLMALFSVFYGCDKECTTYCDRNILHDCTNDGGLMGGKDNWEETDCSKDGMICLDFNPGARCVFNSEKCDGSKKSFCKDNRTTFYCLEYEGKFYEEYNDNCHLESEVCVEFSTNALCLIPVDECDPEAESVCFDKYIGKCHENENEFYFEQMDFCQDSYGKENKCIYNSETKSAHCLSEED